MRVGIVVYEGSDELDVVGPHRVLGAAGFDLEVLAEEAGLVTLEIVERRLGKDPRMHLEAVLERETPMSGGQEGAATG